MLAKNPCPPSLHPTSVVRETTAERINRLANLPEVHPHISLPGQGEIDLSGFVAKPENVVLMDPAGSVGICFDRLTPGIYEAHTQAAPEARGAKCLATVRAMLDFMFLMTDAVEIWTRCPVHNPAAEGLARAVGGTLDFERPAMWPTENGPVAVRFYCLNFATWARTAAVLPPLGRWFHERLEAENARLGIADELHDDDEAHDRHVGAAVGMILGGQIEKGVTLYNRAAVVAGYGLIAVMNRDPLILHIGTHVLRVHGSDFEVLPLKAMQ